MRVLFDAAQNLKHGLRRQIVEARKDFALGLQEVCQAQLDAVHLDCQGFQAFQQCR